MQRVVKADLYRAYPCVQCPWRAGADLSSFSDGDMSRLVRANGAVGVEAARDAPAVACHLDQPDTSHPMRLCAGWLAVVGRHHLGIRMAVLAGRLPEEALAAGEGWPSLYESLDDLLADRAKQLRSSQQSGRQRGT